MSLNASNQKDAQLLPLSGIRILDLTQMLAGPYAARHLADLGAELIKIESCDRYDPTRGPVRGDPGARSYPDNEPGERPWNRSHYNEMQRNKLGVTIALNRQDGVDVFKMLLRVSDVVIENFSARVMKNLGLSYETLSQVKSDIIMCSMPALGTTGPERDNVCYGTTMEMLSGMTELMGYTDGLPMMTGLTYGDTVAGVHAAFAILVALRHKRRTGEGQYIDLSQLETMTQFLAPQILGYSMNHRQPARLGNRHSSYAPHGIYPTSRPEVWISIAVTDDEEWQALCKVIGNPGLADDTRFRSLLERYAHQDELDTIISEWTSQYDPYHAQDLLQRAGVAAGVVNSTGTLCDEDPHLASANFFQSVTHAEAGTYPNPSAPWIFNGRRLPIRKAPPLLGEDNGYVFSSILGLTTDQFAALEHNGVIGTMPAMAPSLGTS